MASTKNLTDIVIKSCYEVHNELGIGFSEKVYENSLLIALQENGLDAVAQLPLKVYFRNRIVGEYLADLVINESIILELKALKALAGEHQAQLINYLKATNINTGLLINFGKPGLEIKRQYNK